MLSDIEKRWNYVRCPRPPNHLNRNGPEYNFIPVCKKTITRHGKHNDALLKARVRGYVENLFL